MKTEKEEIKKITLRELLECTNEDENVYIYKKTVNMLAVSEWIWQESIYVSHY